MFRFNLCKSKAPLDASSMFANVPLTSCDWLPNTFIDPSGLGAKLNVSNIGVSGNGCNSISADLIGVWLFLAWRISISFILFNLMYFLPFSAEDKVLSLVTFASSSAYFFSIMSIWVLISKAEFSSSGINVGSSIWSPCCSASRTNSCIILSCSIKFLFCSSACSLLYSIPAALLPPIERITRSAVKPTPKPTVASS